MNFSFFFGWGGECEIWGGAWELFSFIGFGGKQARARGDYGRGDHTKSSQEIQVMSAVGAASPFYSILLLLLFFWFFWFFWFFFFFCQRGLEEKLRPCVELRISLGGRWGQRPKWGQFLFDSVVRFASHGHTFSLLLLLLYLCISSFLSSLFNKHSHVRDQKKNKHSHVCVALLLLSHLFPSHDPSHIWAGPSLALFGSFLWIFVFLFLSLRVSHVYSNGPKPTFAMKYVTEGYIHIREHGVPRYALVPIISCNGNAIGWVLEWPEHPTLWIGIRYFTGKKGEQKKWSKIKSEIYWCEEYWKWHVTSYPIQKNLIAHFEKGWGLDGTIKKIQDLIKFYK